jgi:mannose-6-phosphate isomerase-like protein (cupin superfamily)
MNPQSVSPYVLRAEEGEAIWFSGNLVTIKAAAAQTRGRLTIAEFINPAGFAPPLHRHLLEDEMFHVLAGTAEFRCNGHALGAGPGDFVFLPVGLPHTFLVGPQEPLHLLQITTPSGFEDFAAAAGEPALDRRLPDPGLIDPVAMGHAADQHSIEILGPPPHR